MVEFAQLLLDLGVSMLGRELQEGLFSWTAFIGRLQRLLEAREGIEGRGWHGKFPLRYEREELFHGIVDTRE